MHAHVLMLLQLSTVCYCLCITSFFCVMAHRGRIDFFKVIDWLQKDILMMSNGVSHFYVDHLTVLITDWLIQSTCQSCFQSNLIEMEYLTDWTLFVHGSWIVFSHPGVLRYNCFTCLHQISYQATKHCKQLFSTLIVGEHWLFFDCPPNPPWGEHFAELISEGFDSLTGHLTLIVLLPV